MKLLHGIIINLQTVNISNIPTTRIIPGNNYYITIITINSANVYCLDSQGSVWMVELYMLDLINLWSFSARAGEGVVVWVLFRVTRLTWLWEECPLVPTGPCYVGNLDRLTDNLLGLMSEHSGLTGYQLQHKHKVWIVTQSACSNHPTPLPSPHGQSCSTSTGSCSWMGTSAVPLWLMGLYKVYSSL